MTFWNDTVEKKKREDKLYNSSSSTYDHKYRLARYWAGPIVEADYGLGLERWKERYRKTEKKC